MCRIKFNLTFVFLLLGSAVLAQTPPFYSKPKEPTFDYLTVDLQTGHPTLYWTAPSLDPLYPLPTGYIIYRQMADTLGNNDYFAIDTVNQNTFQYTDVGANCNLGRVHYRIASNGPTEPSRQTLAHANTWITVEYDSCHAQLKLIWERYKGWTLDVVDSTFQLYMSNSPDSAFQLLDNISKFENMYRIDKVEENQDYYFYLSITRNDTALTTLSNLLYRRTKMPLTPQYITIDSILASDLATEIFYKIEQSSELSKFLLIRGEYDVETGRLFNVKLIEQFDDKTQHYAVDSSDAWAARTRPFYYKIDAYNSCQAVVRTSNLCNTIILKPSHEDLGIKLGWDNLFVDTLQFPERTGDLVDYRLYRFAYPRGMNFDELGEMSQITVTEDTTFIDDLQSFQFATPPYQFVFKYYVEAREYADDGQQLVLSRSRLVPAEVIPTVVMPQAIAPTMYNTSYGHSRNIFAPVISFDAQYQLTIYDRWGSVIYNGDHGWDGTYPNGDYAVEGVYLYRLEVFTHESGSVVKNGNVTVVYPSYEQ